jgi:hypothetical protein
MCPPYLRAHTQVRPYNSFSYFYERISVQDPPRPGIARAGT